MLWKSSVIHNFCGSHKSSLGYHNGPTIEKLKKKGGKFSSGVNFWDLPGVNFEKLKYSSDTKSIFHPGGRREAAVARFCYGRFAAASAESKFQNL